MCATLESDDGQIVAAGWAQASGQRARLWGKVHPDHRRRGLGTYLLRWTEEQGRTLGSFATLSITNETLNKSSIVLYEQEGYSCNFVEQWMQRDLREPLPVVEQSFYAQPWTEESAGRFFEAYREAFSTRRKAGSPEPVAEEWIEEYVEDPDFRPDLSLVVEEQDEAVGFLAAGVMEIKQLGQTCGWVSQVGVRPEWRGRGVGAWLVARTMESLRQEGLEAVGLHVNVDNPGAIELYERLGFRVMGRRGVYSKPS